MSSPLTSAGMGSFTAALAAISEQGSFGDQSGMSVQLTEFAELLSAQDKVPELLEELKDLLPEAEFARIESLLTSGNVLPLPAVPGMGWGLPPVAGSAGAPVVTATLQADAGAAGTLITATMVDSGTDIRDSTAAIRLAPLLKAPQAGAEPAPVQPSIAEGRAAYPAGGHFTSLLSAAVPPAVETLGTPSLASAGMAGPGLFETGLAVRSPIPTGQTAVSLPLGAEGWDKAVGERIMWMVGRSLQGASLRITPPQLGPIDIQLSLQQDQASINFSVPHAVVREALEASIPRLRELFMESNLQLVSVDVTQRDTSGQRSAAGGYDGRNESGGSYPSDAEEGAGTQPHLVHSRRSDGLLDDYA